MNEQFLNRMKEMLQDEYEAFEKTLDQPMYRGYCINTAKINPEEFLKEFPYKSTPSRFYETSYTIDPSCKGVGNHWLHLSGCCYMQEPSASSAVGVLDVQENMWVLDLCAAPGGKSAQIAAKLNNTGFLLSNELDPKRANILLSNMERCGVSENMITNASAEKLCLQLTGCFDRVLVDAPCSGEGMMKKHENANIEWSQENIETCAKRQSSILDSAVSALKENGILVYSTCTYAMEENEQVIEAFLLRHPEMELMDCGPSITRIGYPTPALDETKVRRIMPMDGGEGHFVAKMRKKKVEIPAKLKTIKEAKLEKCVLDFLQDQLTEIPAHFIQIQNKVYARKAPFIQLDKLNVLREGICVGEIIKGRFEPHHHFYTASALTPYLKRKVEINEEQLRLYLSGNVLPISEKGYVAICYKGIPLGFGKGDGTMIKNKYPKGLRVCY